MKINFYHIIICFVSLALLSGCKDNTYSQGKRLYIAHCGNCHMDDGLGLAKLIPPLANADYLRLNQDLIPCIIRNGQKGKIIVNGIEFDQIMPGEKYTEIQINNMINYINSAWGNDIPAVTINQTKERLNLCKPSNN